MAENTAVSLRLTFWHIICVSVVFKIGNFIAEKLKYYDSLLDEEISSVIHNSFQQVTPKLFGFVRSVTFTLLSYLAYCS